jgi:hypothetical protein
MGTTIEYSIAVDHWVHVPITAPISVLGCQEIYVHKIGVCHTKTDGMHRAYSMERHSYTVGEYLEVTSQIQSVDFSISSILNTGSQKEIYNV